MCCVRSLLSVVVPVTAVLADPSLVVSIVGEAEEAESFVLSQSVTVEEDSDGEQEMTAEGEDSERVGSGATYVHIVEKVEYAL